MLTALVCLTAMVPATRHALLLYLPTPDALNDCLVMQEALQRSHWDSGQIVIAAVTPQTIAATVSEGALRWPGSSLLVFLSGAGSVNPSKLMPLVGNGDQAVSWDSILEAFPRGPKIQLIADTGYTNLIQSFMPPNVIAIVPDATWRNTAQARQTTTVVHNGKTMEVGILSYILSREFPFSTSMRNLAYRVNKTLDSGSMAAIWAQLPRVKLLGKDADL